MAALPETKWDKIRLENLIYFCAAQAGCEVFARAGRLYGENLSPLLMQLISLYNRFFTRENRRFLAEDTKAGRAEIAAQRRKFLADCRRYPLLPGFPLLLRVPGGNMPHVFRLYK